MPDNSTMLIIGPSSVLESRLCEELRLELKVLHASNADEVIDVTTEHESIGVILVDVMDESANAFETCMWLKTDDETRDIPIVVFGDQEGDIGHWLNAGAVDYLQKSSSIELVLARLKNLLELKHKTQLLGEIASLDALTAVPNRQRLDEYLDIEWRRSLREFYPLSLIKIDIDGFTSFNDIHGFGRGDEALRRIARSLQGNCNRAADMVSRYGADEFMILLPSLELENALIVAERMVECICQLAFPHEGAVSGRVLTVSAGVATIEPSRDKRYQDIFDEAQEVLYRAQQMGGNQAQGISL